MGLLRLPGSFVTKTGLLHFLIVAVFFGIAVEAQVLKDGTYQTLLFLCSYAPKVDKPFTMFIIVSTKDTLHGVRQGSFILRNTVWDAN